MWQLSLSIRNRKTGEIHFFFIGDLETIEALGVINAFGSKVKELSIKN